MKTFDFIRDLAVEEPGQSPFLKASFMGNQIDESTTSLLPFFGTDIGLCSLIKPQVFN